MQGRLSGSQYRAAALKSSWIDFFSLPAGASHGHFLTTLHYIGFVCTNEWSCSLVTDLEGLITTNSCRSSLFAQDIKMWGLESNNQTGKVKDTEVDEKVPVRFSGTRNLPFLLGLTGGCSCALDLGFISSSHPPGPTVQPCSICTQQDQVWNQSSHHKEVLYFQQSQHFSAQNYMLASTI